MEKKRNQASTAIGERPTIHTMAISNSPPIKRSGLAARDRAQAGVFGIEKQGLATKTEKPTGRLSYLTMK
jgi:hypothetical protein